MAASNPQLLTWDVTLRVVTPVHIGDNTTLRGDLADFVIREIEVMQRREPRLLVTNWESLLTAVPLDVAEQATRSPQGLRNLVSAAFEHPRDTRYSVRLLPGDTPGEMRNFIRDGMGEIYIPGSSIKGAIRTALVARAMAGRRWSLGGQYSRHPERDLRGNDAPLIATSRDARQLSAPNRDILRFLRVSDFYPRRTVPTYAGSFRVGRRADLPPRPGAPDNAAIPVWAEILPPEAEFHGTISIAEAARLAAKEDGFSWADAPLDKWLRAIRERSAAVAGWADAHGAEAPPPAEEPGVALLNIGFGGGWRARAVPEAVPDAFVINGLSVQSPRGTVQPVRSAGEYPRTVRTIKSGPGKDARNQHPGWVKLTIAARAP